MLLADPCSRSLSLSPCAAVVRKKYDGVFRSVLQSELSGPMSEAGSVSEAGARKLLQRSKISEAELDRVLELADLDRDGRLTLDEFAIAMHLVTKRTAGEPLPEILPTSMRPASAFLAPPLPSPPTRRRGATVPTPSRTPGRAGAEASTSSPYSAGSVGSSLAVSFAQDLAADVFSSADPSFLDAATLRADRAAERAARDALERASSSELQLQARELEERVRELGEAKGALQAVSVHVVARHREAEELKLRIAATEQQRAAVAKEHEWCMRRLASLRGQCESYAGTLREKQHELHSATQELEALAREVTAVQTRMASQLDEAHALNRALITAREEVRALKQSQALLLQQAHVESKQVAPLHLEFVQLTAEIGVLQQQMDATVANDLGADGRPTAPAVEYRELQQQVGEARRQRQLLEEELMDSRSNRTKQKASVESTRLDAMRRELGALQVESARARQTATVLRTTPTASKLTKLALLDETLMVPPVTAASAVNAASPPVNATNFVPPPALSGYAPPPALGGRAPPPAPASAAFSSQSPGQSPVSFSPAMTLAQSAAGSPDTGLNNLSSAWSAQPPGPPTREPTFEAQPFRPPPFTPSSDPKRAWHGVIGSVQASRAWHGVEIGSVQASRPPEPSSKPDKPTRRRQDKAPNQVGVLAFQSSTGDSSPVGGAPSLRPPPGRGVTMPTPKKLNPFVTDRTTSCSDLPAFADAEPSAPAKPPATPSLVAPPLPRQVAIVAKTPPSKASPTLADVASVVAAKLPAPPLRSLSASPLKEAFGDGDGGFGSTDGGFDGGDGGFGSTDGGFGGGDGGFGSTDGGFGGGDSGFDAAPGGFAADVPASFGDAAGAADGGFGGDGDGDGGFGSTDGGFGDGDGGFGSTDGGFGDGDGGFGSTDGGFGDGDGGFGSTDGGFGGGDSGFGGDHSGFDAASGGFSVAPASFGDAAGAADGGFDGGNGGFGGGDSGFVVGNSGFGSADSGFGAASGGFGDAPASFSGGDSGFSGGDSGFGDAPASFGASNSGFGGGFGSGGFGGGGFDEPPPAPPPPPPPAPPAPPPAPPPSAAPAQAAPDMSSSIMIGLTELKLAPEKLGLLGSHRGVAIMIDVPGMVGETPPTLKAAMDETGRASFRFGRAFSVADRARREELARVLRMDEKESMVEMVAFALDGPYPDGEPGDDFGVASISLRKLLRSGADHALGPIQFVSVLDGKMIGQLTCAVTAVQALSTIEAERGGRDRAATLPPPAAPAAPPQGQQQSSSYTFGEGPLGLALSDFLDSVVVSNEPAPGSQAHTNGVTKLMILVGVNFENVRGLPKDACIDKIKACGRPLTLQFLPPPGESGAVVTPAACALAPTTAPSPAPPAPSPSSNAGGKAKTMNGRPVKPSPYKYKKELEELVGMGFSDTAACQRALDATNGNVDAAINKLVG